MNVTIPITISKAGSVITPVSLAAGRSILSVRYSDGTIKNVGINQDGEIVSVFQDGNTIYASSEGCELGISFAEGGSLGDDYVLASISLDSCSVSENTMNANVVVTIDGVTFLSGDLDWGGEPGQWQSEIDVTDFEIQS